MPIALRLRATPRARALILSLVLAVSCTLLLVADTGSALAAAPTVTVTGPSSGSTVKGVINLGVNAYDDNAVLQVKWYVDGREVWWDGLAPWSGSWDSATVSDGEHVVFAKAMDNLGAWGTSSTVTFSVANTTTTTSGSLDVAVTAPGADTTVSGAISLAAITSDDWRAQQMKWILDGNEIYWDSGLPWTGTWNSTSVSDGTHSIIAKTYDPWTGRWISSPAVSFDVHNSTTTPTAGDWRLVLSDDFEGSALDLNKWLVYGPNWAGHAGNGLRDGRAVSVQGGALTITAQMLSGTLVSGAVAARVSQAYGRYEFDVRTDVDPSKAMSGVVLTWPDSNNAPIDGENDIYETLWNGTRTPFYTFIHYGSSNQQDYFIHTSDGSQWHKMAMEWEPTAIRIYRDNMLVWTLTDQNAIPDVVHHLCIQLDAFAKSITSAVRLQVDNVRIYARA